MVISNGFVVDIVLIVMLLCYFVLLNSGIIIMVK